MLENSKLVFLDIYVSDVAQARAFYEDKLKLRVLDAQKDAVSFDCGHTILNLRRAKDAGIKVPVKADGSADIVFLVDDLKSIQAALEARGVVFSPTQWYEVGGLADFYDPDFHWLTLYQPSDEAMSWPSADKIRAVINVRQQQPQLAPATPEGQNVDLTTIGLDGKELIYLFVFVSDPEETETFYHKKLGLQALEGGPCSRSSAGDVNGVVKYDTGGIMLTTHFIDEERTQAQVENHMCPPKELDLERLQSVRATFHVSNVAATVASLKNNGVCFEKDVEKSKRGAVATFADPTGHIYHLLEPSPEALASPTGEKLRQILATPF